MANHFDVVPVRTNDERCIVIGVIVRAQARRAIILAARIEGRAIEIFDLPAIFCGKRQVKVRRLLGGFVQAQ